MGMTNFCAFSLLLLFVIPEVTSKSCHVRYNGCSIPGNLPFFYKTTFTPACNKHDVCYFCGQHYGWKRSQCDKTFHRDMKKLCNSKRFFKASCLKFAEIYYSAVAWLGKKEFNKTSPLWCQAACVKRRGDPAKNLRG